MCKCLLVWSLSCCSFIEKHSTIDFFSSTSPPPTQQIKLQRDWSNHFEKCFHISSIVLHHKKKIESQNKSAFSIVNSRYRQESCFKSCRWTAATATCSAATAMEKTSKLIKHRLTQVRKSRSERLGRMLLPLAVPPKIPEMQRLCDKQQVPGFGLRIKKPTCTLNGQNVPHAFTTAWRSLIDFSRILYGYKDKYVTVLLHNSVYKKLHS